MARLHILLTGATGYIGGGVLGKLYPSVQAGDYTVTALVRSQEKALPFKRFGISTVVGTLDDFDVVAEETAKADVVIHTASDEHIPAIEAIESGARKRLEEGKQKTIVLHTSGCGFAIDDEWGVFNENRVICDDSNVEQYMSVPETAPHRACELRVLQACAAGSLDSYIISPSVVCGVSTRALQGTSSVIGFGPKLHVGHALQSNPKQVRGYGPGLNRWNLVHVNDLADLYILVLEAALKNGIPSGFEGIYYAENGAFEYRRMYEAFAQSLYNRKLVETTEIRPYGPEILDIIPWARMVAGSSLVKGTRARALLGWKPIHSLDDVLKGVDEEVEVMLASV